MRLTAQKVQRISEPGKYYDESGLGLFLRVRANGTKYWVQRLTINRKRSEIGLGSPTFLSLADARELAFENKRMARAGQDPLQAKRNQEQELTFSNAVEKYLDSKLSEFKNDKHRKQWRSTLETYADPVIGRMRVSEIEIADIMKVLSPIWTTKTETASRLRGRIESVLSWSTVQGFRSGENPARWKNHLSELLPKPNKIAKTTSHPALPIDEAAEWYSLLKVRKGISARALQFAALNASRSGEVRGMTWKEVNWENALWTIPADRMKTGKEHRVPLSNEAISLLESLPRSNETSIVFFSNRHGMLSDMSLSSVMRKIHAKAESAGLHKFRDKRSERPAVPHGLRSTFRDWCAERTDFARDLAEIALAHNIGNEVERAYRRSDMLEKRRALMSRWASFLNSYNLSQ